MEKTKMGISVALMTAICWLLGYYGGYVVTALLVGYILLKEENVALKKSALKVFAVMLLFSLLNTVIYLIPNLLNVLYSFLEIFNVHIYLSFIDRICNFISNVVGIVKLAFFLIMAVLPLTGKEFKVPLVDELLDKLLVQHAE